MESKGAVQGVQQAAGYDDSHKWSLRLCWLMVCVANMKCSFSEWRCRRDSQCVAIWKRCDGVQDCKDLTDEMGCRAYTNNRSILYNSLYTRCQEKCSLNMSRLL